MDATLQSDTIHFYATQPQHFGALETPDISYREHNSLCGDEITVHLQISDGVVRQWSFSGNASMITIACSGLFGDIVQGKNRGEILSWNQSTIIRETGVTVSPRRERAQVLALLATRNALHTFAKDGKKDDFSDVL